MAAPGRGRGGNLLELLKKNQPGTVPGEAAAAQAQSSPGPGTPAPALPPSAGRGRSSLLLLAQKCQQSSPTLQPTAPLQTSTVAQPSAFVEPQRRAFAQPANVAQPSAVVEPKPPPTAEPARAAPSTLPARPSPLPSLGRGSLLNLAQKLSDPGTSRSISPATTASSTHPTSSGDGGGVLGRLALLAVDGKSQGTANSEPISRQGESGKPIDITANYINLIIDPGKGIFRYEVKFSPEVDAIYIRRKLLNQHAEVLGNARTFDGVTLYLPTKLPQVRTILKSEHPTDGTVYTVTIIFQAQQTLAESITFFNVLLGRVMRALDLVRIGRDNYNPRCAHAVPQHRMELWPGYVTAIDEYEGGLKLNINASHRVMRTDTVRDLISDIYRNNRGNMQEAVNAEVMGVTVLTRYNNRTYRIDDVDWSKTPTFAFERKGEMVVVHEYYKSHWNIEIKDLKQPLLVHRYKEKTPTGETKEGTSLLVPELCYLSGLTDKLRSDFRVMRDLAVVTQVAPEARRNVILSFLKDVKNNPVATEVLNAWGLRMADDTTNLGGRVLPPETITFGRGATCVSDKADWSGPATKNPMLRTPHMKKWCILATDKDARTATEFVSMLRRVAGQMSMEVTEPIYIKLKNDRTESYLAEIRKVITPDLDMVVAICPTNRNDRYAAIKKLCCAELPVKSQVIVTKTISRADKLKSVSEKIALQINCKLGGALWALQIPFDNCMICGVDVYHAPASQQSKGSVAAFTASLDKPLTSWYSTIKLQRPKQELIDLLKICLESSIKAYAKKNGCFPQRIILYRDGVGDGQLDTVANYEVRQLMETFATIEMSYQPKLTVIVVQKRVNTRLMAVIRGKLQNPPPGTIIDSVVTRRNWYDFFLVPQTSRQGTVSPTHYIVIHDGANMKTDHVQRLSFKLCHLYYNWPGTVRVPAPCQYAHKLAYLVGQSVGKEPSEVLADSLYYL